MEWVYYLFGLVSGALLLGAIWRVHWETKASERLLVSMVKLQHASEEAAKATEGVIKTIENAKFRPGSRVRVSDETHYFAGKVGTVVEVNHDLGYYPVEVKFDDIGGDTFDYDELEELK